MEFFLLIVMVYLMIMVVVVLLLVWLGLGLVFGYLILGILIGLVLGLVGSEGEMVDLQYFVEFGVVMMLFLIGLEFELCVLWVMCKKLVGLVGMQIFGMVVLLVLVVMVLNQIWQVVLMLGMILLMFLIVIVLQMLLEKLLMQMVGGCNVFVVLLMQDIVVILIIVLMFLLVISVLMGVVDDYGGVVFMYMLFGWVVVLVMLVVVVVVVLIGQFLICFVFCYVYLVKLNELDIVLVLLIVVGIVLLMEVVGFLLVFGMFFVGVMLVGLEFWYEFEGQIVFFKGLLLGVFFIIVGVGMDFGILVQYFVMVLGVMVVVIVIKVFVLYLIVCMIGLWGRDWMLFILFLVQVGEFGFVLIFYVVLLVILLCLLVQGFLLVIVLLMLVMFLLFILFDFISCRIVEECVSLFLDEILDCQLIIVVGIGCFGQVVNWLVIMLGFEIMVIDYDLKIIQLMCCFGFKGYFGDLICFEILIVVGLDKVCVLVVVLDDLDVNLWLIYYVCEKCFDLVIIVCVCDWVDVYCLYVVKVDYIVCESFDSLLCVGCYVLEYLGMLEYEVFEFEIVFYCMDCVSLC